MVNNSPTKQNNHLSPQTIKHKQDHDMNYFLINSRIQIFGPLNRIRTHSGVQSANYESFLRDQQFFYLERGLRFFGKTYFKQELLTLREHRSSPPVFLWDPCCSCFQFFVLSYYGQFQNKWLLLLQLSNLLIFMILQDLNSSKDL